MLTFDVVSVQKKPRSTLVREKAKCVIHMHLFETLRFHHRFGNVWHGLQRNIAPLVTFPSCFNVASRQFSFSCLERVLEDAVLYII